MGILGGSFNPPHLGHLALARHALAELALDRVLLVPARVSPLKVSAEDPGPEHRLQMCRLLVCGVRGLSACAIELERDGPSFTVDTLRSIHASHPDAELTFIVGADVVSTLPEWREPGELLRLAALAVAERAGSSREEVLETVARVSRDANGAAPEVRFLAMDAIEISSSEVRGRAARGEPIDALVGADVARYIARNQIYGARPRPLS